MADTRPPIGRWLCAAFFTLAGIAHFVIPDFYLAMMPPWLPAHLALVGISGVAEIAGGLGLLVPRYRRAAAIGLVLLLIAVFPANIQMLLNARAAGVPFSKELPLWLRLPLQPLFVYWVWRVSAATRGQATPAKAG